MVRNRFFITILLTGIVTIVSASLDLIAQPEWVNDGLVAYYPLDGDTADHSGNGNDAVLKGNATFEENGGLLFDEVGDRLGLPFAVNQNEISFSLFYTPRFYFEGSEQWMSLLARDGGAVHHLLFDRNLMTYGVWNAQLASSAQRGDSYYPAGDFEWGSKMHFIVSINGDYTLYQNGQMLLNIPNYTSNEEFPVQHISGILADRQIAQGSIDEVRIYNRALTGNEAEQLYVHEQTAASIPQPILGLYLNSTKPADFSSIGDISYHDISYTNDAGGESKSAALFDGEKSYIEIQNANWGNRLNFTTSFWINLPSIVGGDHMIVGNYPRASANGWGVYFFGGKLKSWYFGRSGNVYQGGIDNVVTSLSPNKWYQVASVYSEEGNSVYINGDLAKHFPWSGEASTSSSVQNIWIGKNDYAEGGGIMHANMELDNLFLYDSALTGNQIQKLYNIQSKLFEDKLKKSQPAILKNSVIGTYPFNGTLEAVDPSTTPFERILGNTEDFMEVNQDTVLNLRNGNQFHLDIESDQIADTGLGLNFDLRLLGNPNGNYLKITSKSLEPQTISLGLIRSRRSDKITLTLEDELFFEHATPLRDWFNLCLRLSPTSFEILLDGEHLFFGDLPATFKTGEGLNLSLTDSLSSSTSGLLIENFTLFNNTEAPLYTIYSGLKLTEADYGDENHHMFRCLYPEYFEWEKPPRSIGAEGKVYEFVTLGRSISWNEAQLIAQSISDAGHPCHLATIDNEFESILVTKILDHIEENKGSLGQGLSIELPSEIWIGAYEADKLNEPTGLWEWVNDEGPVRTSSSQGFSNWNGGEPNNTTVNRNFMTMYSRRNTIANAGKWNDADGEYTNTFLLEYKPNQTLEASYVMDISPDAFSNLDSDSDGLTDNEEAALGTDAFSDDTDQDSLLDLDEVNLGTNPLIEDTDGDGLSDGFEAGAVRYEYITGPYSWLDAFELAESRNLHLATITSDREQSLIISNFKDAVLHAQNTISPDAGYVWLGGTDIFSEGRWEWVTGEPFEYFNWFSGEPNNAVFGEEYILMYAGSGDEWKWNDYKNSPNDYPDFSDQFVFGVLLEDHYPSDPLKADTDSDGFSDLEERENNTNPNTPTFELQALPQTGGSVSQDISSNFYELNSQAVVSAIPDVGYAFDRWSGSLDSFENPLIITVSEPLVLIPIFKEAIPPTIDSTPHIGSLIEGQSQTFQISYSGTAPFTFQWFKDGVEIDNTTTTLSLSNVTSLDAGVYTINVTNEYGTATLDAVTLSVISPIRILSQSETGNITEGQALNLVFEYSGTEPASIQWFKDGVLLDDFDSNVLFKEGAAISDSGVYAFTVSNELGTVESNPIAVTVSEYFEPPIVTQFMVSPNPALVGSSLALTTAASGDRPFTFSWYRDDVLLGTSDLPIYSIESVTESASGNYSVIVSNRADQDKSSPITVSVVEPISITEQPQDTLIMENTPLELSVTASGGGQITYTWYRDNKKIDGATSSTYRVPSSTFADTGDYHVVVSDGASTVKSAIASVLVTPFIEPPSILIQPKSKKVNLGDPSSMVLSATGAEPLKYQWYLNGNPITGAIKNFTLFDSVTAADAGTYTVTVTNDAGSVTSVPATLSLILPLGIVTQSGDVSIIQGDSFILEVEVNSPEDVQESYWAKDGSRLPDSAGFTYEVVGASLENTGSYTFHATDGNDWIVSDPMTVQVNQPPVFITIPEDITASSGQNVMLQWVADGTGTLKYDLLLNNEVLDSNDTGTFRVKVPELGGDYEFVAKVSSSYGSSTSTPVIVSVQASSPIIIDQSTSITMVQRDPLELNIKAIGGGLAYQWYKGAAKIPDANSPVFIINETGEGDAGTYFVVVSNSKGIVTSNPMRISFGVNVSVQADGANIILKMNPGDKVASWKLQKSYDLLFWEDDQNLEDVDLGQLIRPIEEEMLFYRVVER
ncbi:MAG: immunoglobulin domain-containing protein [Verrucomicrobiota bacterium]